MLEDRIRINNLLSIYEGLLTDKQRRVLKEYYELDLSLFEIAEQYSITRQAVRDTIVRATKQLDNYEDKLRILAKNQKLTKLIQKLAGCKDCGKNIEELKCLLED